MPSETRLTPAARKAAKRPASTEVGLASRLISASSARSQRWAMRAMTAATVSGAMSEGVPPPKNTLVTRRPGVACA